MVEPEIRALQRQRQRPGQRLVGAGERHGGRQAGRDIGREARSGENRDGMTRRGFRENLRHEQARTALDALRAGDQRGAGRQRASRLLGGAAGRLGGNDDQRRLTASERSDVRADRDAGGERRARQPRALAALGERAHRVGVASPQDHAPARARGDIGQGDPPGARAGDADRRIRRHHPLLPPGGRRWPDEVGSDEGLEAGRRWRRRPARRHALIRRCAPPSPALRAKGPRRSILASESRIRSLTPCR